MSHRRRREFDPIRDLPLPDPNSPSYSADLKSFVAKILTASPFPPRFYRDSLADSGPNSTLSKILRNYYQNIFHGVHMTLQQSQSPKSSRSCTHIKSTGRRCESPSLRGEQFCYFHQRMHRGVRTPPQARLHPIALIEDEESIQVALMEVMNALLRNTIDLKRATLILRALHIAVKNASRARFEFHGKYSVRDIPQYSEPNQDHVGADAFVRPGPDASVRSAAASVDDDLSIREFDAPPPNEPPQRPRRPRRTRDELYAEYYGYPTVEAFLASPEGKRHYPPAPPQAQVTQDGRAQITANAPNPSVTEVEGKLLKDGKSERQHETKTAPRKPPATVKAPLTAKQKNSLKGART